MSAIEAHRCRAHRCTQCGASASLEHLKGLSQPTLRQASLRSGATQPPAQELFQADGVTDLADMATQRGYFAREGVGDVHVVRRCRTAGNPDLADGPRLELFISQ